MVRGRSLTLSWPNMLVQKASQVFLPFLRPSGRVRFVAESLERVQFLLAAKVLIDRLDVIGMDAPVAAAVHQ